jgi:hypothetical protein
MRSRIIPAPLFDPPPFNPATPDEYDDDEDDE